MSYPSTVDSGGVTPWYLAHRELIIAQTAGAGTRTANATYLHEVDCPVPVVVTSFSIAHGATSAGNFDLGIYDNNGNLLVHTGVTSASGFASATQTISLATPYALGAGRYYFALWVDNSTDTYFARTGISPTEAFGHVIGSTSTNTGGLASTFSGMGGTNPISTFVPFLAHLQGTGF